MISVSLDHSVSIDKACFLLLFVLLLLFCCHLFFPFYSLYLLYSENHGMDIDDLIIYLTICNPPKKVRIIYVHIVQSCE